VCFLQNDAGSLAWPVTNEVNIFDTLFCLLLFLPKSTPPKSFCLLSFDTQAVDELRSTLTDSAAAAAAAAASGPLSAALVDVVGLEALCMTQRGLPLGLHRESEVASRASGQSWAKVLILFIVSDIARSPLYIVFCYFAVKIVITGK
jgi:hypothetical protein